MVARYDRPMQSGSEPGRDATADRSAEPMLIVVSGAPGSGKATRHPCHLDRLRIGDVLRELADGSHEPLAIPDAPTLIIRTDHGMPDIGPIRSFLSSTDQ
jgi:hypothetical protein